MKQRSVFLAAICAVLLMAAYAARDTVMDRYGQAVEGQTYRTITEDEALMLAQETEVFWIDVRETGELENGRIAGALHWPLSDFDTAVQTEDLSQDTVLLLYCSSGVRSGKAARKLTKSGYRHVFNFGSIQDWHGDLE